MTTAFQPNAFQPNAFQIYIPVQDSPVVREIINRKGRVPAARKLGIANYIYMQRKQQEDDLLFMLMDDD